MEMFGKLSIKDRMFRKLLRNRVSQEKAAQKQGIPGKMFMIESAAYSKSFIEILF